jgi:integrase
MIPNLKYHCLVKNERGYIRLRFSYGGKKIDLYPPNKIVVKAKDWDKNNESNPIKKSDLNYKEKNIILADFKSTIENTLRVLQIKGISPTKENIHYFILSQKNSLPSLNINYPILEILYKWRDNILVSKLKSDSYKKTVKSVSKYFEKFFTTKIGIKYNSFEDINRTFFDEYYNFCVNTLDYSNDTIKKHIYTFKTFLRWALDNKFHSTSITQYVPKMSMGKHDIIYLNEDEVLALWNFTECEYENYVEDRYIDNPKHKKYTLEYIFNIRSEIKGNKGGLNKKILTNWELVRDMYVFACSTGLRYSDVINLKCDCIEDKGDYISIVPQKTQKSGIRVNIPMANNKDNIMRRIFWKYVSGKDPNQYVFPQTKFGNPYPNQKINLILKQICSCDLLKSQMSRKVSLQLLSGDKIKNGTEKKKPIYEVISFHSARRTYATRAMKIIGDADQIMKITGHLNKRVFSRYVGVNDKNLHKLSMLWNEKSLKGINNDNWEKLSNDEKMQFLLNQKINGEITERQFNIQMKKIIK